MLTYDGFHHEPADCECGVEPNLDWSTRETDGVVGVSCVAEPACFRGWAWVPRHETEWLRCRARDVFRGLAPLNGLEPLGQAVPSPFLELGQLRRRGLRVVVVWLGVLGYGVETLCRGLRAQLGLDGLIVLVPREARAQFRPEERIALVDLPDGEGGSLGLSRGLDVFDPGYRRRAASREHPDFDVDFIRLRFATRADRHVLSINGHEFDGFKKSDVLFAQLLMLAASRKQGRRDGWRNKAALIGDFAPRPADATVTKANRALENLRAELGSGEVPGLTEYELDAIIKTERGSGRVRLGVPPENINFDASLETFEWKLPATIGSGKKSAAQDDGLLRAIILLDEVQRLGVAAPTTARSSPDDPARPSWRSR
ncbi:MAG: hypothetical protein Q8L48_25340 [Archangium sp.]|nr:hypothetical protein [Archangium sp.]